MVDAVVGVDVVVGGRVGHPGCLDRVCIWHAHSETRLGARAWTSLSFARAA